MIVAAPNDAIRRVYHNAATFVDGGKAEKVQSSVDAYTKWVIENLVGTKGTSDSDVVATILREWVTQNRDLLETLNLWPPQVKTGKLVITPPGA